MIGKHTDEKYEDISRDQIEQLDGEAMKVGVEVHNYRLWKREITNRNLDTALYFFMLLILLIGIAFMAFQYSQCTELQEALIAQGFTVTGLVC